MKKQRFHHSISRQFIVSVLLIFAVLVGAISFITSYLLTQAYDKQIENDVSSTSESIQQTVRAFVDGAYNLSYELAVNPSIMTMDGAVQAPILASSAQRNDYFELLYVQGVDGMQTARSSGSLGDRSNRWWFIQMMEQKQPFVSQSYYSVNTQMPCTSVFIPMYRGSEMVGIFGADIKLGYIQQLIEQFADQKGGKYSFIIDGDGVVMAHPDSEYLETLTNFKTLTRTVSQKDASGNAVLDSAGNIVTTEEKFAISDGYRDMINKVMGGESGTGVIKEDGATYYVGYAPINLPGESDSWSVITLQDKATALGVVSVLIKNVVAIAGAIAIIAVLIIILMMRRITKPVAAMARAAQRMAGGDLQVSIDYRSGNEVGILAESLREFIGRLSGVIGDIDMVLSRMSEGDMTAAPNVEYNGEFESIQNAMVHIGRSLGDMLSMIDEASDHVSAGSDSLSNSARELSRETAEQSETFENLHKSVKTLSTDLKTAADSSGRARAEVKEANKEVIECNRLMSEMTGSMSDIRRCSDEIGKIIKTIEDIAFQTNILALNASVEAARAGAHGKGFAVVAEEVRNLASKSAEAAKHTGDLINSTLAAVENGVGIADETAQYLLEVVKITDVVSHSVEGISTSIAEQADIVDVLLKDLGNVAHVFRSTAETSKERVAASEELSAQAEKLKRMVSKFKV